MLLKPGWIIFLMMFWVVIQLLITIGDTSLSMSNLDQAPIIEIIESAQKINTITGAVNPANWGNILTHMWEIFTFQANFLTGAWTFISVIFTCIYAGLGLSMIYTFVSKIL
jgi:hypothetical protein